NRNLHRCDQAQSLLEPLPVTQRDIPEMAAAAWVFRAVFRFVLVCYPPVELQYGSALFSYWMYISKVIENGVAIVESAPVRSIQSAPEPGQPELTCLMPFHRQLNSPDNVRTAGADLQMLFL